MLKLNLRDLFWVVLVAGIVCAWCISYRRQAGEIDRMAAELKAIKSDVWAPYRSYGRGRGTGERMQYE